MRIAVVIPAYNEAGNIGRLIDETVAAVPEASLQVTLCPQPVSGQPSASTLSRIQFAKREAHSSAAGAKDAACSGRASP
jgi:hypothetical protein